MSEHVIIIEQRLRTRGLVLMLAAVTVIVSVVMLSLSLGTAPHSPSAIAITVEVVVVVLLLSAIIVFLRVTVRVVDTPAGRTLEVIYGPGGLVRQVFGPDRLVGATTGHFSFAQMGGWGYRGSLTLFRRASLATRRGDALDVSLTRQRRFIVTVDDPADFVTALTLPPS